jgi:hypothetical protein
LHLPETPPRIPNIIDVNLVEAAAHVLVDKFGWGNVRNGNNKLQPFLLTDGKYIQNVLGLYDIILS